MAASVSQTIRRSSNLPDMWRALKHSWRLCSMWAGFCGLLLLWVATHQRSFLYCLIGIWLVLSGAFAVMEFFGWWRWEKGTLDRERSNLDIGADVFRWHRWARAALVISLLLLVLGGAALLVPGPKAIGHNEVVPPAERPAVLKKIETTATGAANDAVGEYRKIEHAENKKRAIASLSSVSNQLRSLQRPSWQVTRGQLRTR